MVALLLVDPGLATSVGFALSVAGDRGHPAARAGLADALDRWLPRWLAEAIAVPAAAQLACTPVVAAISGQVSLVAVAANLAVAPAVGPATVLGLAAACSGWSGRGAARRSARPPRWCVAWIVEVARRGADAADGRGGLGHRRRWRWCC